MSSARAIRLANRHKRRRVATGSTGESGVSVQEAAHDHHRPSLPPSPSPAERSLSKEATRELQRVNKEFYSNKINLALRELEDDVRVDWKDGWESQGEMQSATSSLIIETAKAIFTVGVTMRKSLKKCWDLMLYSCFDGLVQLRHCSSRSEFEEAVACWDTDVRLVNGFGEECSSFTTRGPDEVLYVIARDLLLVRMDESSGDIEDKHLRRYIESLHEYAYDVDALNEVLCDVPSESRTHTKPLLVNEATLALRHPDGAEAHLKRIRHVILQQRIDDFKASPSVGEFFYLQQFLGAEMAKALYAEALDALDATASRRSNYYYGKFVFNDVHILAKSLLAVHKQQQRNDDDNNNTMPCIVNGARLKKAASMYDLEGQGNSMVRSLTSEAEQNLVKLCRALVLEGQFKWVADVALRRLQSLLQEVTDLLIECSQAVKARVARRKEKPALRVRFRKAIEGVADKTEREKRAMEWVKQNFGDIKALDEKWQDDNRYELKKIGDFEADEYGSDEYELDCPEFDVPECSAADGARAWMALLGDENFGDRKFRLNLIRKFVTKVYWHDYEEDKKTGRKSLSDRVHRVDCYLASTYIHAFYSDVKRQNRNRFTDNRSCPYVRHLPSYANALVSIYGMAAKLQKFRKALNNNSSAHP